jgi:hypothetical protein
MGELIFLILTTAVDILIVVWGCITQVGKTMNMHKDLVMKGVAEYLL